MKTLFLKNITPLPGLLRGTNNKRYARTLYNREHLSKPSHAYLQCLPSTCEVDAKVSFSITLTIKRAGRYKNLAFMKQATCGLITTYAQLTNIQPCQIGPLQSANRHFWQSFIQKPPDPQIIVPYIQTEVVEPLLTLVIGCLKCRNAERIDIAHLVDINHSIYATTQLVIPANQISVLQASCVE